MIIGSGLAPDVVFVDGVLYLCWGAKPDACVLASYTPQGVAISRRELPDGFFNSFPRFGPTGWLGYKTYPSFTPSVVHVVDGWSQSFPLRQADGNWPLFVTGSDILWQTGNAYDISIGACVGGLTVPTRQHGAPDGIERFAPNGRVVCRKDIREEDPSVGGYPSHAGDLTVGQYGYGVGVKLDGDVDGEKRQIVHWIAGDPSNDHPDPRCATDGTNYAIVCWGQRGIHLWVGTRADVLALPLAPTDAPVPDHEPDPEPEPDPMADLNLFDAVRAERAKYPAMLTSDQPAKILNAVAWANRAEGWGLSVKPNGNHVMSPQGVFVAYDILHNRHPAPDKPHGRLFGCFTDELAATVNWGEEIYHGDPVSRPWLAPIRPVDVAQPPPPPPPVDLTARVVALEAGQAALRSELAATKQELHDAEARLGARIGAGAAMDPAALRAAVEGILGGYEAFGSTGRAGLIPHSHENVRLVLRRK